MFTFWWGNGQRRTRNSLHLPDRGPSGQAPPSELLSTERCGDPPPRQVGLGADTPCRRQCPQLLRRPLCGAFEDAPCALWACNRPPNAARSDLPSCSTDLRGIKMSARKTPEAPPRKRSFSVFSLDKRHCSTTQHFWVM